ncbi:MAG: NAD-dependent epimerase/dehydratase family protein [Phycisphaerae bacterium]|nr:NAD-dependent epimerase/dehydratase family protein [Phycisphaerae bacterium]
MTKRVLVTGAAGFAGAYMCDYLAGLADRPRVVGADIAGGGVKSCDSFHSVDLSSADRTSDLIRSVTPDYVIHLAGTFGTDDWRSIYSTNVLSALNLLEAVRLHRAGAVVIMAGSAAEYGSVPVDRLPMTEQLTCTPVTPYGLSKAIATQISEYYHRVHKVCTMVVRPFQLIGKGVTPRLAPGAFASRLAEARRSGSSEIKVGNLAASRDFLDVRDAARAVWMLCEKPAAGQTFNVCSGKPVRTGDLLDLMMRSAGIQVQAVVEQSYLRGNADADIVYGSYDKIREHCGWQPVIPLQDSIRAMFE